MNLNQLKTHVQSLRDAAGELVHRELEAEMWRLMDEHPKITAIVKCMGEVSLYNSKGPFWDDEWPRAARRLRQIAELDTDYYSLTGHPLKLYRGTNGQVLHTRDW